MRTNIRFIKSLWFLGGLLAAGCSSSGSGPTKPTNAPPTVTFTFSKLAVARGSNVTLTTSVDDPDMDPVSLTWAATRGVLGSTAPQPPGTTSMTWTVPNALGTDTLTVTADDGEGGTSVTMYVVRVATLLTADVNGPVTWLATNSPFLLDPPGSNISIASGGSLTIEAGTELFVNKVDLDFLVQGTLTVNGTPAEPVQMVFNATSPDNGAWGGITGSPFAGPPVINLNYAHISHAKNAIKATQSTQAMIKNCKITFCSDSAILHNGTSALLVEDCVITNNTGSGIRIERIQGAAEPASITIRGDSIAFNGDLSGATVYTEEAGISISLFDDDATVPISITDNHISINGFPGIRLDSGGCFPTINNNSIFGNERNKTPGPQYNLRLETGFNGPSPVPSTIDATNNYWAQLTQVDIEERVYDRSDNITIETNVNVTPWLTSAP